MTDEELRLLIKFIEFIKETGSELSPNYLSYLAYFSCQNNP
jgi:radical SAM superfamily enzyme YgiQ (UPF0313 family)